MKKSDLIKCALRSAIKWEESFLDSLGNYDPVVADRSRKLLESYKKELAWRTRFDVVRPEVEWKSISIYEALAIGSSGPDGDK